MSLRYCIGYTYVIPLYSFHIIVETAPLPRNRVCFRKSYIQRSVFVCPGSRTSLKSNLSTMSSCVTLRFANGPRKWETVRMPCAPDTRLQELHSFLAKELATDFSDKTVKLCFDGRPIILTGALLSRKLIHFTPLCNVIPVCVYEGKKIGVYVKTLTGKTLHLDVCTNYGPQDFKLAVQAKEGIPPDQQRFIFAGKQFSEPNILADLNVDDGATLHLIVRLRGGGGIPLVNIENEISIVQWSQKAPEWRCISEGFCVEAMCTTDTCAAYQRNVLCSMEFGVFEMERLTPSCPMCRTHLTARNIGFNNCMYRIRAVRSDSLRHISIPWTKVGNHYQTWDEEEAGVVDYEHMAIEVRSPRNTMAVSCKGEQVTVPIAETCAICLMSMQYADHADVHMLPCAHSFHEKCWGHWEAHQAERELPLSCPICRAPCP